jgi:hypothetical protein
MRLGGPVGGHNIEMKKTCRGTKEAFAVTILKRPQFDAFDSLEWSENF